MSRGFVTMCLLLALDAALAARADGTGDPVKGRRLFAQCGSCHTIVAGESARIGPNLHGLIGRKAGSVPGFEYSDAMKNSGIVWDERVLDEYLKQPSARVPANKMVFAGVPKDQDRADIIAYLKKESN
jgi:cytochrome c